MLAMLLASRGRAVSADALAEELWGSSPAVDVAAGLYTLVSRVRRVLPVGATLEAKGSAYTLRVGPVAVDVERFEALVGRARECAARGETAGAVEGFRGALGLWRGDALAGFVDREFARGEARRLEEARLVASEEVADALLTMGDPAAAVATLEPVLAAAPYREDACGRLMLALYRAGRQADALAAYRRLRAVLADELGLEPGPALRRLEGEILAQSPELDGPPARAAAGFAGSGMRAFLFTDIEASTRRWEGEPAAMAADLARHDELLRAAIGTHGGRLMSHTGDGCCADFPTVVEAVQAAVAAQRALLAERWSGAKPLRARMAVHVGAAQARDGNWFGPVLNRTARLMAVAAGGQLLVSHAAADLARDGLPDEVGLLDLGEHALSALDRPERVFQVTHPALPAGFPRAAAALDRPHNLPGAPDRFIGRETELAQVEALLRSERLVSLWGPGGAGKTRLSIEAARRVLAEFADGVWFVELAPHDRPEQVAVAVATALGVHLGGESDVLAGLCRYLTGRQLLLVLDNCEHLVEAVAELTAAVLTGCPGVRVFTSSRELLGVAGEVVWAVPSLSLPAPDADLAAIADSDAVTLFCARASAAQPGFGLTEANADAVVEICRRLDGIPLALELAAPRVRMLGVRGLAQRLGDRFAVLGGSVRGVDARHRTLRAAVDWSWELLPPAERDVLARLSVFAGSFDLAAAEHVAAAEHAQAGFEILDLLTRLVDRSLVVAVDDADGGVRYRLLETIRQYADERLAQAHLTAETSNRHLEHYRDLPAYSWSARYFGSDPFELQLPRDVDNQVAALEWALARDDFAAATRLACALWLYWAWSEYPGVWRWFDRLAGIEEPPAGRESAELFGMLGWALGRPDLTEASFRVAGALDDARALAVTHLLAGEADVVRDPDCSRRHLEDGLALLGDDLQGAYVTSWLHQGLSWACLRRGEVADAHRHATAAAGFGVSGRTPVTLTQVAAMSTLAVVSAVSGDAEAAEDLAVAALAVTRSLPLRGLEAVALCRAAQVACLAGRWERAAVLLREQLVLLHRVGTHRWVGDTLELTALTLEGLGHPAAAAVLSAADAHRADRGESRAGGVAGVVVLVDACQARLAAGPVTSSGSTGSVLLDAARFLAEVMDRQVAAQAQG